MATTTYYFDGSGGSTDAWSDWHNLTTSVNSNDRFADPANAAVEDGNAATRIIGGPSSILTEVSTSAVSGGASDGFSVPGSSYETDTDVWTAAEQVPFSDYSDLAIGVGLPYSGSFTLDVGDIELEDTDIVKAIELRVKHKYASSTYSVDVIEFRIKYDRPGISDPDNAWSNDSNAFDGNDSTFASSNTNGTKLIAIGTNAPSTGSEITQVRARFKAAAPDGDIDLYIYDNDTELYFDAVTAFSAEYSSWSVLTEPSGGWTWEKVTSLRAEATYFEYMSGDPGELYIVELEVTIPNDSPTTTLNSPANNTTLTTDTPELRFTATDPEGEDVQYQIQVSTQSNFSSLHTDHTTTTYPSGVQQSYTISALTKGGITYYWRVRAKDPSGSNSYGEWSATRTMITEAIAPTVTSGSATSVTTSTASVAGNVTATGGASVTERGIAYGLSANPTTANNKQTSGSGLGAFTANLTGLSSNTEYHYRAYAINSKGTSYGSSQTFTTLPIPPTVQTGTAGSITLSSATISGNTISANPDSQTITERGVVYSTAQNPTTASNKQTGSGSPFNVNLTGLSENTTYYVRAYATWSGGTVYGSQISFRTTGRPSVTLNTPSASGTVADVRPELKFTGVDPDSDNITYQLQISSASNFASTVVDVLSGNSAGFTGSSGSDVDPFFSGSQITYKLQQDLNRGSDYYWRVRGKDPSGSDTWGEWTAGRKFTVDAVIPSLTLNAVHTVLDVSAKADAVVSSDGGASVTERGIVWSTSQNPTTADDKETASGTTGAFTADLTDLTGATTYYVRAYAINAKGTAYSNQISFQTLAPIEPPSVTTGNASFVTDLTARIAGEVTSDGTRTILERGICFSEDNDPPTVDDRTFADVVNAVGAFEVRLTGLDPETTYYYRAYAVNDQGVGYGETKTFTTAEPYLPDEGDGYWTWSPGRSQATITRTQPTPAFASVNLPLAELGLEDGKTYTFSVGDIESDNGAPSIVLERVEDGDTVSDTINPNSSYTFTYDEDILHWTLRLFVTGEDAVADDITASFYELYMAEEPAFSEFVPFTPKGVTEIRIANNELVDKRRSDVIQTIYDALHGASYYPFNIDTEGLGWLEIGDGFTITDPDEISYPVAVWNSKITIDGGIKENLFTETPDKTYTDYKRAGDVTKRIKNAQIIVDKQNQTIEAITSDMYEEGGYINEQFSQVYQDIQSVTTTVQGAGGVNLIRNSVMYAYDDEGVPENWEVTGDGELKIQASPESRAAGGVSGNAFTLIDKTVTQRVEVKKDVDFIPEDQKTYYTLSLKVKKNTVGAAYIKLSNRNEEHQIDFPDQEEYYWASFDLPELLPQDAYFDIEIYSDADAELQVTDLMLSIGKYRHEWTQANGEIMNTSVAITEDGMTIRSAEFRNDYTKMTALGLEVHSKEAGGDRVFGFNKDETNVSKLKADQQVTMLPLRMVPIEYDSYSGWAIAPAKEND